MITAKGVGFLIAAVLLFFLARLTGVGWLYLVDSVLWGVILFSALLPWLGVVRLEAQQEPHDRLVRAEAAVDRKERRVHEEADAPRHRRTCSTEIGVPYSRATGARQERMATRRPDRATR